VKKASERHIKRFHDLRHFYASMLIAQGENPKYIQDQLGHASITTTFYIYGHLMLQARQEASAKLEGERPSLREGEPFSESVTGTPYLNSCL
jgi:integrase